MCLYGIWAIDMRLQFRLTCVCNSDHLISRPYGSFRTYLILNLKISLLFWLSEDVGLFDDLNNGQKMQKLWCPLIKFCLDMVQKQFLKQMFPPSQKTNVFVSDDKKVSFMRGQKLLKYLTQGTRTISWRKNQEKKKERKKERKKEKERKKG